ncbi:MAG: DUF1552 domain-containing protein [Verrucomicrobiota bacterium]
MSLHHRRDFLRRLGLSAAALPLLAGLPSLNAAQGASPRRRIIFVFSPNGTIPSEFWPEPVGDKFRLKRILAPLTPFRDRLLTLRGVNNRVRGDGDGHMRGMSCLLTGIELFPGNIQGGGETPAGWASGPSIDQEIRRVLQSDPATRTRHGSLEFGVAVPNRADPWTRWSYAGPNQPMTPVTSPYAMFDKLYGQTKDRESLVSVLDGLRSDLARISARVDAKDREALDRHATALREMEKELQQQAASGDVAVPPAPQAGVPLENDNIPEVTRMQTELLISAFQNDLARVATFQFTHSVGQARMRWVGVEETHHALSHDPDLNAGSQEKLIKINVWFAEQLAHLAKRLQDTPEPGGRGSMLDHTTVVWTNELGNGNSHTHEDIPWLLLGGGLGFRTGRALAFDKQPHNRLLLSLAHAFGHRIPKFGNPSLCEAGPLDLG